jgi:hypothetical protein
MLELTTMMGGGFQQAISSFVYDKCVISAAQEVGCFRCLFFVYLSQFDSVGHARLKIFFERTKKA